MEAELGRSLQAARIKSGMSQSALATKSGVSDRTIRDIELGNAEPTVRVLGKLAKALGKRLIVRLQ